MKPFDPLHQGICTFNLTPLPHPSFPLASHTRLRHTAPGHSVWDALWGGLRDLGPAVVVGEWGGEWAEDERSAVVLWQRALARYMSERRISYFYW